MDVSEQLVLNYLHSQGYSNVIYEPDGNVPPDFSVNGSIGVEVRRLNENFFSGSRPQGLEEVEIPLSSKINALLHSMGAPITGKSWFVDFSFSRPVKDWKILKEQIQQALLTFLASPTDGQSILIREENFQLSIISKASFPQSNMFLLGGCQDDDSGGWLLDTMERNIDYCAKVKEKKIAQVRCKYSFWWLVLVDHVAFGLGDYDRNMFRQHVSINHGWDKIILIDPLDHNRWFEI